LNDDLDDSFLVPNNIKNFKTGVNISVDIDDETKQLRRNYPKKQKHGLGFKPTTFISEVKYDDVSKVYYHEHRETTNLNREYPNVKFMLKRYLSDDLHKEAQNIAKNYAAILWERTYFNTTHTLPIILENIIKQKFYWKTLYDNEYQIRKDIENAIKTKKEKKTKR